MQSRVLLLALVSCLVAVMCLGTLGCMEEEGPGLSYGTSGSSGSYKASAILRTDGPNECYRKIESCVSEYKWNMIVTGGGVAILRTGQEDFTGDAKIGEIEMSPLDRGVYRVEVTGFATLGGAEAVLSRIKRSIEAAGDATCSACRKPIKAGSAFCPSCGAKQSQ